MRILSWNVNGIRTVRQYRPLYKLKWSECLEALEADIICFQETKITRKQLLVEDRDMCLPKGYYAFYNLHPTKGYSGTTTFVRDSVCTPQRAEEGITGNLVKDRRDSKTAIGGYPDLLAPESPQFDLIDREGRAVVVDCGMFVLFNLYCPNETDEGRREYKMAYYTTLEERVHNLLEAGREVIIVGDLNIAHLPIDHADSVHAKINAETHLDQHPARRWLDRFLTPVGRFMDAGRHMHPRRRFMYTCWNTIKNSRASNYGARIDFTLLSPGLVDWVKDAGIQPDVQGSDHCPVYVDLHDEITLPDGSIVKLRDKLSQEAKPPPLATSSWPEHSGRRIQSFFAAGPSAATPSPSPAPNLAASSPSPVPSTATRMPPSAAQKEERSRSMSSQEPVSLTESRSEKVQTETTSSSRGSQSPGKAVKRPEGQAKSKEKVTVNGSARKGAHQATLKSFFGKSPKEAELPAFKAEEEELERQEAAGEAAGLVAESEPSPSKAPLKEGEMVEEEDSGAARVQSSLAWGSIFAPRASPRCGGHNEPAKPWTVNKPGPNHGRKFWMCARPVGGTGEPDHDKQFRCGFWKWDSEVRTKAQREDSDEATGGRKSFHEVAGRAPMLGSGEKRTLPSHSASSPVKRRRDA